MGEIPEFISFPPPGSLSLYALRGAADVRGAHQIGLRPGRAHPLYRLTLARPPFPLPFPCPLSLSSSSLTASPLQPPAHLFHLSTLPRGPQTHRRRPPARAQISVRRDLPALPPLLSTLGAPARAAGALRIAASLFVPRLFLAGRRPAAAPPTPRLRVLKGLGALACQTWCRLRLETVSPELMNPSRRGRQSGLP